MLHAIAAPNPPPNFWIFRFKRGKMLEYWDKGLFFDRAAAAFITREEYERRHPGILARDAPEAGEPAPPCPLPPRAPRIHKIWSAIYRRAGLQPWERDGVSRATWYRRSAKASKPEGGGEPDP